MDTFAFLRAVAASDLPRTDRDVLRTLQTWASVRTWECWPSVSTIADAMGVDRRTVQRSLGRLRESGLLSDVGVMPAGQARIRIDTDRLNALAGEPPDAEGERHDDTGGAAECRRGGVHKAAGGRHDAAQTDQETNQITHHTTPAAAVASLLGSEDMLSHPNATPERLEWIAREAPTKNKPAGWAAGAIREAYVPPPPTDEDRRADRTIARNELLARFEALHPAAQADIQALAIEAINPTLDPSKPHHRKAIRGAIAQYIAANESQPGGALPPDQPY
ncbi:MAG: helix-turn-helix domain-containing protein [Planctomycetota bacterium]